MTAPRIASRAEWLAARKDLLSEEKAHSRAGDALAAKRRALPWVEVTKDYRFQTDEGEKSLSDLFGPHSQLIIQHFMFAPGAEAGCALCSMWADNYNPMIGHFAARDVAFVAVSRAPLTDFAAYKARMGWGFDWVSSHGSDFNFDYQASATEEEAAIGETTYNFRKTKPFAQDMPGASCFARKDGKVYHTYSVYSRGLDRLNGVYNYLDIAPKGRDEAGLPFPMAWVRRHDEYQGGR